jgi:O-antigen/teichoic acid export membrane protein
MAAMTVICAWTCYRTLKIRPRWERASLGGLIRLSGYQFTAQIAGKLKTVVDPFIVGAMLGPETTGGYALTLRAHDTVRLFASSLGGSLGPGLAHLFGEGSERRFRQVILVMFRMMALMGLVGYGGVIALNESFVAVWAGEQWFAGQTVSILAALWGFTFLVTAAPFEGMYARGEFYVIGKGTWEQCESHPIALTRLDQRQRDLSPHGLAARTLESLEIELASGWESPS